MVVSQPLESRSAARLAAVQALFQMEFSEVDANDVVSQFVAHRFRFESDTERAADAEPYEDVDIDHFSLVAHGVVSEQMRIDRILSAGLSKDWSLNRLDSTLRAVLRAAVFELLEVKSVPARVVINEYVNVAHAFFNESEPRFANGVLDRVAHDLRADEFAPAEKAQDQS